EAELAGGELDAFVPRGAGGPVTRLAACPAREVGVVEAGQARGTAPAHGRTRVVTVAGAGRQRPGSEEEEDRSRNSHGRGGYQSPSRAVGGAVGRAAPHACPCLPDLWPSPPQPPRRASPPRHSIQRMAPSGSADSSRQATRVGGPSRCRSVAASRSW